MEVPRAAPARLGRYELIARLAMGGMGEIFLARLEGAAGFEKLFVIKRILPHLADDPRFRAMLIAEARIASMMTHANICHVYELGETDGLLYIVMEYLEGITLLALLSKLSREAGVLELGFLGGVIQQVTDGLHYAHELKDRGGEVLGIVHRDVTPSNLFLTDAGVVKVLDFGIAKVKDASAQTQTGTVKGKYAYMAPEQLRGASVDRRADVFALGIIVYEMLALRRLFQRRTDYLTFRAVMEQPIVDVRRFRPDCPAPLAALLSQALDRTPERRFETARQFGTAVQAAIGSVSRPWTQGEIADFVAASFGHEFKERSAQIASAVRTGAGQEILPLIARSGAESPGDEDDELAFPPIDSAITEITAAGRHAPGRSAGSAEYVVPGEPYAGAPVPGMPAPGVPAPPSSSSPPIVVVHGRRSLVWPLAACAMVAITGGALFLVWRQMQNQQPTSVVITNGSGSRVTELGSNVIVVGPDVGHAGGPAVGSNRALPGPAEPGDASVEPPEHAPGKGSAARNRPPADPPVDPHADPYYAVVRKRQADANRCTKQHGNPPPGTRVLIVVAPDGHPRSVTIVPESVGASSLGVCIKSVFQAATFPRGDGDHDLEVKLVRSV